MQRKREGSVEWEADRESRDAELGPGEQGQTKVWTRTGSGTQGQTPWERPRGREEAHGASKTEAEDMA